MFQQRSLPASSSDRLPTWWAGRHQTTGRKPSTSFWVSSWQETRSNRDQQFFVTSVGVGVDSDLTSCWQRTWTCRRLFNMIHLVFCHLFGDQCSSFAPPPFTNSHVRGRLPLELWWCYQVSYLQFIHRTTARCTWKHSGAVWTDAYALSDDVKAPSLRTTVVLSWPFLL